MLQRFREYLTLVLLAFLPFHAFFVTVGTKLMRGPGHAPMPILAAWKEGVIALLCIIALVEMVRRIKNVVRCDLVDVLVLSLLALALAIPSQNFLFGFKYDFIPLVAFIILRRVDWPEAFRMRVENVLLWVGGIVAAYGIFTLLLPNGFFYALGYSDAHSLYLPGASLAAFQQISGSAIHRMQSTFSGPNQLGIWLLIPLSIVAVRMFTRERSLNQESRIMSALMAVMGVALILTFSRSAWIAAVVIGVVAASRVFPRKVFVPMVAGTGTLLLIAGMSLVLLFPSVFVRKISLEGHLYRPLEALQTMVRYPLGLGLGSAGPASNRISDPCVYLEAGADASWAAANPALCVFAGDVQVQPQDRSCTCPVLPENWYLQIGVELGVLGLLLYMGLVGVLLWRLVVESGQWSVVSNKRSLSVFLIFVGISIAALFLHAWEDAAVAYTAWVLGAITLRRKEKISR